jgi:MoaA/NifB/PqqE/SkfB family radical SAM enzyme
VLAEARIVYRLLRLRPVFVGFNVTNRCTMRCRFCSVPALPNPEMTPAEVRHCLGLLRQVGIPVVGITGGEPFLREDLAEVMAIVQELGMKTTLVTNGELLDERRMKSLAGLCNVVHFALSVDSLDLGTYGFMRKKKGLPEILSRFLKLIPLGPKSVYKLNVVLWPDNVGEIPELLRFAEAAGLGLTFIPANTGPGGLHRGQEKLALDEGASKRLAEAFLELYRLKLEGKPLWDHRDFYLSAARYVRGEPMGPCHAGRLFLDLRSDGGLAVCNEMPHSFSLLETDSLGPARLAKMADQWAPRVRECSQGAACCYTCSYNVAATASNIPAYLLDYARFMWTGRG